MRGIFNSRPSLPKYTHTWEVNIVLNYLDSLPNNSDLSLLQLSQKLSILLMLLSGQRCQTVHLIKLGNIEITGDTMTIYIGDLVKQSKPGKHLEPLVFSRFSKDKLCVIKTMQEYVNRTVELRGDEQCLFIACVKPHKVVTKSTIARWIKQLVFKSGINVSVFGTHSCRSASTSSFAVKGVPIDNIMKSAGWASSQTFYKFYFKPVKNQTVSESILQSKK